MKKTKLLSILTMLPLVAILSACNSGEYFQYEKEDITNSQVNRDGYGVGNYCPSHGEARVLVIPIKFTDFEIEATYGKSEEEARLDMQDAFFGDSSDTIWHSLKSYYEETSYGKLSFSGYVMPWQYGFSDFERQTPLDAVTFAKSIQPLSYATMVLSNIKTSFSYYKNLFVDESGNPLYQTADEFLQDFDSDGDGSIDYLSMVYSAPINYGEDMGVEDGYYWAYCGGTSTTGNKRQPDIGKWAFFAYQTFFEEGYYDENGNHKNWTAEQIASGEAKVDCHTLIHETGHALSLWDYYDTSYSNISPLGRVDMMDNNVGDHNAYSKAILGWIKPYMVNGSVEIKIRPFASSGDAIFIPYNGYYDSDEENKNTYFSEYIVLEYYTPTGLNERDSQFALRGAYPTCPSESGIKILHVDSRLGVYSYNGQTGVQTFTGYTNRIIRSTTSSGSTFTKIATSNTKTETVEPDEYLISLLPQGGRSSASVLFNNASLFKQGDSFNGEGSNYQSYLFHTRNNNDEKVAFGYTINIVSITSEEATIQINAIA